MAKYYFHSVNSNILFPHTFLQNSSSNRLHDFSIWTIKLLHTIDSGSREKTLRKNDDEIRGLNYHENVDDSINVDNSSSDTLSRFEEVSRQINAATGSLAKQLELLGG